MIINILNDPQVFALTKRCFKDKDELFAMVSVFEKLNAKHKTLPSLVEAINFSADFRTDMQRAYFAYLCGFIDGNAYSFLGEIARYEH